MVGRVGLEPTTRLLRDRDSLQSIQYFQQLSMAHQGKSSHIRTKTAPYAPTSLLHAKPFFTDDYPMSQEKNATKVECKRNSPPLIVH